MAVRLFRKAIRSREISEISEYERDNAFFYLAIAYLEGKGVMKSLAMARKLLERANQGDDHRRLRGCCGVHLPNNDPNAIQ